MKKIAISANWTMLAIVVTAYIVAFVRYPGVAGISSLVLLVPYALSLLALKAAPNRALAGIGMLVNVFIVALCVLGLIAAFKGYLAEPIIAGVVSAVLLAPSIITCKALIDVWERARLAAQR